MKALLISVFLLTCVSGKSQDSIYHKTFPVIDSIVTYQRVIKADSIAKDQIYVKAKEWAVSFFVDQKHVLQTDDKESGMLTYKFISKTSFQAPPQGLFGIKATYFIDLDLLMKIYFKDYKLKISISDIVFDIYSPNNIDKFKIEEAVMKDSLNMYMRGLIGFNTKHNLTFSKNYTPLIFNSIDIEMKRIIGSLEDYIHKNKKSTLDF